MENFDTKIVQAYWTHQPIFVNVLFYAQATYPHDFTFH